MKGSEIRVGMKVGVKGRNRYSHRPVGWGIVIETGIIRGGYQSRADASKVRMMRDDGTPQLAQKWNSETGKLEDTDQPLDTLLQNRYILSFEEYEEAINDYLDEQRKYELRKLAREAMEENVAAVFTNAGFAKGDFKVMVRADYDGSVTVYSIEFVDDGIQKLMNYVHSGRASLTV